MLIYRNLLTFPHCLVLLLGHHGSILVASCHLQGFPAQLLTKIVILVIILVVTGHLSLVNMPCDGLSMINWFSSGLPSPPHPKRGLNERGPRLWRKG